jgi:ribosomal protein L37AE/L43A
MNKNNIEKKHRKDKKKVIYDTAKKYFCCDHCKHNKFRKIKHLKYGTTWNCTRCKTVHLNSSLYPPCAHCGTHKFYKSSATGNIVCNTCNKAID